ncbi:MAG TPA: cytochrome C oxidase subunit IV family protein [Candidatus Angelobacter sp.]|nr:cytochrome C oxidase subunit IV family protein [Candidatus Angelobacter sp.]
MSEHSHPTLTTYFVVFFALVAGTVLTYSVALVDLGKWNPVIALTIACTKATFVILYFMHVRYSSKLTILTVCAGFFWLLILITLSLTDYLTRTVAP